MIKYNKIDDNKLSIFKSNNESIESLYTVEKIEPKIPKKIILTEETQPTIKIKHYHKNQETVIEHLVKQELIKNYDYCKPSVVHVDFYNYKFSTTYNTSYISKIEYFLHFTKEYKNITNECIYSDPKHIYLNLHYNNSHFCNNLSLRITYIITKIINYNNIITEKLKDIDYKLKTKHSIDEIIYIKKLDNQNNITNVTNFTYNNNIIYLYNKEHHYNIFNTYYVKYKSKMELNKLKNKKSRDDYCKPSTEKVNYGEYGICQTTDYSPKIMKVFKAGHGFVWETDPRTSPTPLQINEETVNTIELELDKLENKRNINFQLISKKLLSNTKYKIDILF